MPLGVQRWRQVLEPYGVFALLARGSLGALLFDVDSAELHPAGWRRFFVLCRETVELLYTLVLVERCSFDDALAAVVERPTIHSLRAAPAHIRDPSLPEPDPWANCAPLPPPERAPCEPPGCLLLGCSAMCLRESDVAMLDAFFFTFDDSSVRAAFHRTMQKIYTDLTPAERRRLRAFRIPVEFTLRMRQGERVMPAAAYARSAARLVRSIAEQQSEPSADFRDDGQWRYTFPFVLKCVALRGIDESSFYQPALQPRQPGLSAALAELMALGVRLHESLMFRGNSWSGRCSVSEIGPILLGLTDEASLRASLDIEQVVSSVGDRSLGVIVNPGHGARCVDERAHERQLQAIMSALAAARDIDTINLGLNLIDSFADKGAHVMQWLVYALFSKDAASSISQVTVNCGSHAQEATNAITSVLAAKNPARVLLDATTATGAPRDRKKGGRRTRTSAYTARLEMEGDDDRDLGFAIVPAGTPITVKSTDETGGMAEIFELKQDGRFRVMRDVEGGRWVDVVVPCYGHCLVARSAIDRIECESGTQSSLSAGYSGAITSLSFGNCEVATVLPLICFVGPKLTSLALNGVTTADNLREILASCPNLTSLVLGRTGKQVGTELVKAYERGRCKIENLYIDAFWKDENTPSTSFIRALQDPDAAVSKWLRMLTLLNCLRPSFNDEVLDAYMSMLATNRRLQFLQLRPPNNLLQPRLSGLMETNGCWVPDRPLSPSMRIAFLSVVRHHSSVPNAEPPRKRSRKTLVRADFDLGRLDRAVVLLIFEFAAHGMARELHIESQFSWR